MKESIYRIHPVRRVFTNNVLHKSDDGMTFFRIETDEEITVSLVNSENEPLKLGVDYPSAFTRVGVHTISEEYALEIEAEDDIGWSVTVEDQPRYTEDDVGETDFPIEISGNTENIFGPFNLNGFHQPRVRTNVQIELIFANQTGEVIERVSTELDENEKMTESFVNLDSVNISEVCWIWCSLSSLFTAIALEGDQEVTYDVQIVEADNS